MGFAMEAPTKWKISAPPPYPPQIPSFFVWDSEGAQKCFILRDQTTGELKSYHLQAQAALTALSVPHGHLFFQQSCYVGNPLSYKYALRIYGGGRGGGAQTLGVSREKQAPPPPNLHPPLTFAFLHFFI